MRLLVIRHAIAMEREEYRAMARANAREAGQSAELNDDLRPLTEDGVRKMKKAAKGLCELVEKPALLVTSPLTRAMQTAEILREEGWSDVEFATCDELRPEAEPGDLVKWMRGQPQGADETCLIAVVGHEPHLSTLVSWFLAGTDKPLVELKKGGACLLQFERGIEKSRGRLEWLATPSILRALR